MISQEHSIKYTALNFILWRIGESVGWDCTAEELAKEAGCHQTTAARHAVDSGWNLRGGHRRKAGGGYKDRPEIDKLMNEKYQRQEE